MEDSGYATHEMQLRDGDLLLLYTDGVTESHSTDKTLFGEERLSQTLQSVPLRSARDAIHETLHAVSNFHQGAPQFDDITLLAIRYRKP